jgi:hypothetical protein
VDLVLAGLYVHLLLTAVKTSPKTKPPLAGLVFAFFLVFVGVVVVRLVRRKQISMVALVAAVVSGVLWVWVRSRIATRASDLTVDVILLVGILLYSWLYQLFAYKDWKKKARPPELLLVIYRPGPAADKAKFDRRLGERVTALRGMKADAALIQAWSLDPDEQGLQGAVLVLDVRDRPTADQLAARSFAERELIITEITPLQKLKS